MKKPLLLLWLISIASTAAGLPYAFDLQYDIVSKSPLPFQMLVLISMIQTAILLAIAVYAGAKSAKSLGLRIFALSPEVNWIKVKAVLKIGIPFGILTGAVLFILDYLFLIWLTPQLSVQTAAPAIWKTLLASFYGGVVEEVLMRLFLMSLLAWLLAKLFKSEKPVENKWLMWSAIVLAAVIFGLGHLPVTAALTAITPAIVARALLLNGIGGLVFGYLYWKKGLEYSIMAHFTTDIVLLAILPVLL